MPARNPGMRGSLLARQLLTAHLELHLNPRLTRLRGLGLDTPDVKEFVPYWRSPNRIEAWPAMETTAHQGVNRGRIDWDEGDPRSEWHWTIRAWFWARGEDYEQTSNRVELVAVQAAETVLALPALGDVDDGVRVLPDPMRISLSDIESDDRMRASIAGAFLEVIVSMAETATTDPLGEAETLTVNPQPKPTE